MGISHSKRNVIMAQKHEFVELPKEIVKANFGFSLDVGCTLTKLVYRAKYDKEVNNSPDKNSLGKLRLTVFPKADMKAVIAYIKEHCDVNADYKNLPVSVTGANATPLLGPMKEAFGVTLLAEMEFGCFLSSASHFYKQNEETFVSPISEESKAIGKTNGIMLYEMTAIFNGRETLEAMSKSASRDIIEDGMKNLAIGGLSQQSYKDMFPSLLVTLGSAVALAVLREDGSHEVVDALYKGSRAFIAMCKLTTGIDDYHKIMELAKNGDSSKIDELVRDYRYADQEDAYGLLPIDFHVFYLAKALRKDVEFKPADVLKSLLDIWAIETSRVIQHLCHIYKYDRVYFAGSFINSETARSSFAAAMITRNIAFPKLQHMSFGFINHGGYLGAVGAYMHNYLNKKTEVQ